MPEMPQWEYVNSAEAGTVSIPFVVTSKYKTQMQCEHTGGLSPAAPLTESSGRLDIPQAQGSSLCAVILLLFVRKGEIMIPIEMTHIGKIEAVGTVQVFGYSFR